MSTSPHYAVADGLATARSLHCSHIRSRTLNGNAEYGVDSCPGEGTAAPQHTEPKDTASTDQGCVTPTSLCQPGRLRCWNRPPNHPTVVSLTWGGGGYPVCECHVQRLALNYL